MKICEDSIRAAIDGGLGNIQMDVSKKNAILSQCRPSVAVVSPRKPLRRLVMVAAAFAVAFTLCGGVLAASPELRASLAILGETAMQQLQPVNQVSEDQGIKMEVLAAVNDGQVAAVFMSLQDTAGLGRVEPTTQLFDSSILGAHFFGSEVVNYDPATETVMLRMVNMGDSSPEGDGRIGNQKITVTTRSVLSGEKTFEPTFTGYTVGDLKKAVGQPATHIPERVIGGMYGGPEMEKYQQLVDEEKLPVLDAWQTPITLPGFEWMQVRAAGFVNNRLHVQLSPEGMGRFSRLNLLLQRPDGSYVDCTQLQLDIGERYELGGMHSYCDQVEYILALPEGEDVDGLRIMVSGVTYDSFIEGNWSTTFRLQEADQSLNYACDIDMGGWTLKQVTVSPIAATAKGTGEPSGFITGADIKVLLKDGTEVSSNGASTSISTNAVRSCRVFNELIDVQQVESVWVNGQKLA